MSGDTSLGFNASQMSPEMAQILSARSALRVLDTSIARTEARLRALPSMVPSPTLGSGSGGGGGSPGGGTKRNGSLRNRFFGVERGGLNVGPMGIDKGGIGLNKGFMRFGGKAVTTMVGFHITAAVGNQIMDLAERDREMKANGATKGERAAAAGAYAAGSFLEQASSLAGTSGFTEMALRGGGFTKEGAQKAVADLFEAIKTGGRSVTARDKAMRDAISKAGAETRKQYSDAYVFLDSWFPDDFDVANELDMKDLRIDMRRLNAGRLEAWMDDDHNSRQRKALRDSRGD